MVMGVMIKPSDLYYRYPRKKENRELPKFSGKPDSNPFDRNDMYEVIPVFEKVMDALNTTEMDVLHRMEEVMNNEVPAFVHTREEMYDCLLMVMQGLLGSETTEVH
ncbi:hypothetical protein SAMN02745165_03017 [Malonomonas rubra DSM 5091]|uniref:Uncharacterized protein n=2 Tax=Malonomonas rubra TaxID=57040 RepID=A0A1M6LMW4_MALRU|nr:hypothetical protein SAMN02745165_03017 [Malonomonas rubra DSM 5091]